MPKVRFPILPTPEVLADIEIVLARRRVFRLWHWRQMHGSAAKMPTTLQFRINHGLQPDCWVSEKALQQAQEELETRLAFFTAFPQAELESAA